MSRIRANTIVNGAGTGAPNFPRGAIISGISTINAEISVGTGTSISSPGTNELAVGTNNTERILINTVGDIGINKSSVESWGGSIPTIEIKGRSATGGLSVRSGAISFESGSGTNGYATLWGNEGGIEYYSSPTDRDTVAYGFKFTSGGNIAFASGKGIDFSATSDGSGTATSELLDEYEEGTFTPNLLLYSSGSILETISPLSSSFKGRYTKIGHRVWVEIYSRYNLSTITSSAWVQTLIELPFTQGAFGGQQYASAFVGYYASFLTAPTSSDANHYFPGGYVGSSTNYLYLTVNQMNAAETYIDENNISSSTSAGIMVSANYCTESI